MAISGVENNIVLRGIKSLSNGFNKAVNNALPNFQVSERADKFFKYCGKEVSSAENRLILGVTALASQPFIDAHNRKIDDDTKRVAVCRTVAKIIAGTTTGFLVRKGTIKFIGACSKIPAKNVPEWRTLFTPKDIKKADTEEFKQYTNALGTFVSLGVMLFTNFLIDAPLTKYLTNKFNDKVQELQDGGAK